MRVFIFFVFLLGNCFAQDKAPLRVCYFSMNNQREFEELDKFNKRLSEKAGERIVVKEYLTTKGMSVKKAFQDLLDSGEKCDGLVFSGHHVNNFYGDNVRDGLELGFLEKHSCDPKYQDWFADVKAVWLQGCNTVRNGEVDTIDTAQYHTFRVGRVLEEDSIEATYADLNREYSATLDQDNPLASRYMRIFPQSSIYGWSSAAPGRNDKSEYAIPYHIAHTTKLYSDKEQYFKNPLEEMSLEVAVKYSEVFQKILGGDSDEAKRCSFEPYALEGWKDITDPKAGKVRHYAPYFQFYDHNASFPHLFQGGINDLLRRAKRYDCLFKNAASPQKLAEQIEELLKDPVIIGYTYNNFFEYLQNLKKNGNFAGYELIKKKLLENANVTNFLMKKMDSNVVGALVKIDYYKFYEELAGKNESFIKNIQNSVLDSLRVGGDQEIEAQVEYQRNLGQALIKNKLIDSSFIRSILDQKDLNTRMLGLAANLLRLSQKELEDDEVVQLALEILSNDKVNPAATEEILKLLIESKNRNLGQDKIIKELASRIDLLPEQMSMLIDLIKATPYRLEGIEETLLSLLKNNSEKAKPEVLSFLLNSPEIYLIQKLKNYSEIIDIYSDKMNSLGNSEAVVEVVRDFINHGKIHLLSKKQISMYIDKATTRIKNLKEAGINKDESIYLVDSLYELKSKGYLSKLDFEQKIMLYLDHLNEEGTEMPRVFDIFFALTFDGNNLDFSFHEKLLQEAKRKGKLKLILPAMMFQISKFQELTQEEKNRLLSIYTYYSNFLDDEDFLYVLDKTDSFGRDILSPYVFGKTNPDTRNIILRAKKAAAKNIEQVYVYLNLVEDKFLDYYTTEQEDKKMTNDYLDKLKVDEWLKKDEVLKIITKRAYILSEKSLKRLFDYLKLELMKEHLWQEEGELPDSPFANSLLPDHLPALTKEQIQDLFFRHYNSLLQVKDADKIKIFEAYYQIPPPYKNESLFFDTHMANINKNEVFSLFKKAKNPKLKRELFSLVNINDLALDEASEFFSQLLEDDEVSLAVGFLNKLSQNSLTIQNREEYFEKYLDAILKNENNLDALKVFTMLVRDTKPALENRLSLWKKILNANIDLAQESLFSLLQLEARNFFNQDEEFAKLESELMAIFDKEGGEKLLGAFGTDLWQNPPIFRKLVLRGLKSGKSSDTFFNFIFDRSTPVLEAEDYNEILKNINLRFIDKQSLNYLIQKLKASLGSEQSEMHVFKNFFLPTYLSKSRYNQSLITIVNYAASYLRDVRSNDEIYETLWNNINKKDLINDSKLRKQLLSSNNLQIMKKFMFDKEMPLSLTEFLNPYNPYSLNTIGDYFSYDEIQSFMQKLTSEERIKLVSNLAELTSKNTYPPNLANIKIFFKLANQFIISSETNSADILRLSLEAPNLIRDLDTQYNSEQRDRPHTSNSLHFEIATFMKKILISKVISKSDKIHISNQIIDQIAKYLYEVDKNNSIQYMDFFNEFVSSPLYRDWRKSSDRHHRRIFYDAMRRNKKRVEELYEKPAQEVWQNGQNQGDFLRQ